MNIKILNKDKENFIFSLSGIKANLANSLRRSMMEEVPTMAIEDVEFHKNSSALYTEVLAHRLGLVTLKTDLKSYILPSKCKCQGEGCAKCQLKLTLKIKGPCTVYASDIKSKDPKVVPVFPKTVIAKLLKNQEIELIATAVLGQGKEHAKWSPGLISYRNEPVIEVKGKVTNAEEVASKCPLNLFEAKKDELKLVKDYNLKCHLCAACEELSDKVKLTHKDDTFIFKIESWGQLEPKEIAKQSAIELSEKSDEFIKLLKNLK